MSVVSTFCQKLVKHSISCKKIRFCSPSVFLSSNSKSGKEDKLFGFNKSKSKSKMPSLTEALLAIQEAKGMKINKYYFVNLKVTL